MATFNGTAGNNLWVIIEPGTIIIDGRGGTDTVQFGTSLRSSYDIYVTQDGAVHVDSISGASGDGALLKSTFFNIEFLVFDSKRDTLDVALLVGDISPPTVVFSDDTPGVASGPVSYTLTFNEAVVGLAPEAFDVSQGRIVSVSGGGAMWSVVVVPSASSEGSIGLTLKSAGVVDAANNPIATVSALPQAFDTQAPRLLSGNPSFGERSIEPGVTLTLTFSESMLRGSGSIGLVDGTGTTVESFDIATSLRLSLSGATLTLDPTRDLASGSIYSLSFGSQSLRDAAGNPLASLGLAPYSFSTAPTSTATALFGTRLAESFTPGAAVLTLDGLGGIDGATLPGSSAAYRTSSSATGFTLTALDGTRSHTFTQVERLVFDDKRLAIDLDGHAGTTAKILGAVFGRESVANASFVGIGLSLLDAGMSYVDLMQLALNVRIGATASHSAVVELLYTNVIGSAPPPDALANFVSLLDSQAFTPATLGVLAADTDFNKVAVDLVGLAQTGLPFIPA